MIFTLKCIWNDFYYKKCIWNDFHDKNAFEMIFTIKMILYKKKTWASFKRCYSKIFSGVV